MDKFTSGIGTRNTSIRIPNHVVKNGSGYLEDRRPASNIDPYDATSRLFNVCCLNK
jgi:glutamine synthetase